MGWKLFEQSDGKYAIWSTIVDNITYFNLEKEDIIDIMDEDDHLRNISITERMIERASKIIPNSNLDKMLKREGKNYKIKNKRLKEIDGRKTELKQEWNRLVEEEHEIKMGEFERSDDIF